MSHTFATKRLTKRRSLVPEEVTVRVNKYDGAEYRRWHAHITKHDGSMIVLEGEFDNDVQHDLLGEIKRGTRTVEFYWLDCWYNIFQFLKSDGSTRLYYCNISTPPVLDGGVLSYTDLDIDILVQPDLSYDVLDLEEFEQNARRLNYSDETKRRAHEAVIELVLMIKAHQFPFVAT
jgi:protein associated with RNAse G/E